VLDESKIETDEEGKKVGYAGPRLVVLFPDTGSAVWSEQDWKAGKAFGKAAKVPPSVRCAAFPFESVDEQDAVRARVFFFEGGEEKGVESQCWRRHSPSPKVSLSHTQRTNKHTHAPRPSSSSAPAGPRRPPCTTC